MYNRLCCNQGYLQGNYVKGLLQTWTESYSSPHPILIKLNRAVDVTNVLSSIQVKNVQPDLSKEEENFGSKLVGNV